MIATKVKAGALQLTLFIVIVIALLLASFLIFVHTYTQFNVQSDFVIETVENANNGIQHTLRTHVPLNDSLSFQPNAEDYKTLKIKRTYWGFFEKVFSRASIKNYKFEKVALIGGKQPKLNRTALFLEDNNKPLVVVGNTKIEGLAYLPERGIKTGNISGHSYYGDRLVYGSTRKSNQFPKVPSELLENLKNINPEEQATFIDISKTQTFNNSFFQPLQIVYSPDEIRLEDLSLIGHIMVQSQTAIVVGASSNLKDIVLMAPKVEIEDNVIGAFQVIASEAITVGNNCKLTYPSALVVYDDGSVIPREQEKMDSKNSAITIDTGTSINGVVFWNVTSMARNYQPQILINEHAVVNGEVFCNSNLELKGTVNGTIYTSNFVAKQSGSIYQNHIYNGIVSIDGLPQEYVGLPFETSKKGIMKWLY